MQEQEIIKLTQHNNSSISDYGKINFAKFKYLPLFEDILWYTYNGSTRQDCYDYKRLSYIEKPYYWKKEYDEQIRAVICNICDISINDFVPIIGKNTRGVVLNELAKRGIDDNFIIFTKKADSSNLDDIVGHIRNAFAHGSFNRINIGNKSHIVLYDRDSNKNNPSPTFILNYIEDNYIDKFLIDEIIDVLKDDELGFESRIYKWINERELKHSLSNTVKEVIDINSKFNADDFKKLIIAKFVNNAFLEDNERFNKKYYYFINSSTIYKRDGNSEAGKDYTGFIKKKLLKTGLNEEFINKRLKTFTVRIYKRGEFIYFLNI